MFAFSEADAWEWAASWQRATSALAWAKRARAASDSEDSYSASALEQSSVRVSIASLKLPTRSKKSADKCLKGSSFGAWARSCSRANKGWISAVRLLETVGDVSRWSKVDEAYWRFDMTDAESEISKAWVKWLRASFDSPCMSAIKPSPTQAWA